MSALVVGYDGSEGSRAALDKAIEIAGETGDSVTAVFGTDGPGAVGGEATPDVKTVEEHGRKALEHAADQARGKGFGVDTKMIEAAPAEALIAEAESRDVRMIVVGNQGGPSPLKGAVLDAVPFRLVHLSPVPVLVVPPSPARS
jgi:nucleotide-binding universal stress UspA family protein